MGRHSTGYPAEVRERAVRLVFEHQGEHGSQWAAMCSIAAKFGCTTAAPKAFPWHTAREQEDYVLYQARFKQRDGTLKPDNMEEAMGHPANIHAPFPTGPGAFGVEVETPDGTVVDIEDPAFLDGLKDKSEGELALHHTQRNIVDCRPVTLFSLQTVDQLREETGSDIHKLQFRANFYVDWNDGGAFYEDGLVGKTVKLGDTVEVMVVERDPRCKFITIHPETAETDPALLRHVTREHEGFAGVYAAVIKEGPVRKGDSIALAD